MSAARMGSTRMGLGGWMMQRVTSVYMAGFALFVIARFSLAPVESYAGWHAWWTNVWVRIATALFIVSLLLHAWLGLRSVWMDYLKPLWLRFLASVLTAVALALMALWTARLLLLGPG